MSDRPGVYGGMSALVAAPARPEERSGVLVASGVGTRASGAAWAAGLVLVAVAGAFDPLGLRPFTTLRWGLVAVLVVAAVAALPARGGPVGRRARALTLVWLGLLAWLALAALAAADPTTALLGHPRRHLGLLGFAVLAAAWWVGTRLGAVGERRHLGRAAVVAGVVTAAGALAVLLGWDPAGITFAGGRVGGLLGQPTYLGALSVLLAPTAAGVAADGTEARRWRWAAVVAAGGCAVAALASGSRGAWLGAIVGAVVAWPHLRRGADRATGWRGGAWRPAGGTPQMHDAAAHSPGEAEAAKRSSRSGGDAAGSAAVTTSSRGRGVALAALLGVAVAAGVLGGVVGRGFALFDSSAAGGASRVDEWRVALGVIGDDPVLGVGPEGYRIAAPLHIEDGYARRHGRDEVVDRAHSGPLDVAAAGGVPAGVAYVVLVGGVVVGCVRVARRPAGDGPPASPVVVGAAVGVVAWAVQQLVSFPIAEVDPAAWLLAGLVLGGTAGARTGAGATPAARSPARPHARRVGAAVATAVMLAGAVTAVLADRELERAQRIVDASGDARLAEAVRAADRATALRPEDLDAWYVAARVAASGRSLTAVDAGLDRVEAGLARSGDDPALRDLHEALLAERALRSLLPEDLDAAEAAARAGIADDPAGPAHHRRLGLVLAARDAPGDAAAAGRALRRALDLDPDDQVAADALAGLRARRRATTEAP